MVWIEPTIWPNKWQCSQNTSFPLRPRHRVIWIKTEREGVKSGRLGALKPNRLDLNCKANKYYNTGTGDLGVLPTYDASSMEMTADNSISDGGSTRPV